MRQISFPMQQGDLDHFCSLYAVINLRHSEGKIKDPKGASADFNKLVQAIDDAPDGSVAATATKGVYRTDVLWLLGCFDMRASQENAPTPARLVKAAEKGAIIFFKRPSDKFDHYTVLKHGASENRLELLDSYGFAEIEGNGESWTIDGEPIDILNVYVLE
ncbi:hypothetical protein [Falsirhodobacter algicola]|uniref:Uncharacterized protein n=1 Tax=Falsirhodobacter algicola TaxID=2692330 RepID=A0A8J8MVB7_9RHOB|nr:hypothetical protein [Falsirhodobacter algicola]QUS37114.1 hypothetical protein GR316_12120 [Falsirhodobacter algicola]